MICKLPVSSLLFVALALGACGFPCSCFAEDIRVRLINSSSGQPMPGQPIWAFLGRDERSLLEGTTDSEGVAIFHLPAPVVDWINVRDASHTIWHCSPYWKCTFRTSEIRERGVVAMNTCGKHGKLTGTVTASPGEVVLFARPLRWYEQ